MPTPPRPEVYLSSDRIAVVDLEGQIVFWATETDARQLVQKGQATVIRKKGRVRFLRATSAFDQAHRNLCGGRGDGLHLQRYSHNHETPENPEKVWVLRRLAKVHHPVFIASVIDCGGATAIVSCAGYRCQRKMSIPEPQLRQIQAAGQTVRFSSGWTFGGSRYWCPEHLRAELPAAA